MTLALIISAIVTIIGISTPILLAATGELVVEKSGVLNLGVEGMMLIGAVTGFAVTFTTFNPFSLVLGSIAGCCCCCFFICSISALSWFKSLERLGMP